MYPIRPWHAVSVTTPLPGFAFVFRQNPCLKKKGRIALLYSLPPTV